MHVPGTERDLAAQGLAHVNHELAPDRPRDGSQPPTVVGDLLSCAIDREVLDPFALYEQEQNRSLPQVARELQLDGPLS